MVVGFDWAVRAEWCSRTPHAPSGPEERALKSTTECVRFLNDAVRVGSEIAADHGAAFVDVTVGMYDDYRPPSISSGAGEPTLAVFIPVAVTFEAKTFPVKRTRKFTIYHPTEGKEVWPSARMVVTDDGCFFELHVGNRLSEAWGILAPWREKNLLQALAGFVRAMREPDALALSAVAQVPIRHFQFEPSP